MSAATRSTAGVDGFGQDGHRPDEHPHHYLEQDEDGVGGDRQYGHPGLAAAASARGPTGAAAPPAGASEPGVAPVYRSS